MLIIDRKNASFKMEQFFMSSEAREWAGKLVGVMGRTEWSKQTGDRF